MNTELTGVVRWDDDGEALAKCRVEITDIRTAQVVGKAQTDARGRFSARVETGDRETPGDAGLVITVLSASGERLLSTGDPAIRLTAKRQEVQLAVPNALRKAARDRKRRPTVRVGVFDLDANLFAAAKPTIVLELALAIVDREAEERSAKRLAALCPDILPTPYAKRTLSQTALLELIEEIIRIKQWPRELRLKVDDILRMRRRDTFWPDRGPEVDPGSSFTEQVHLCPNFRITYQDSGPAAVDPATTAFDINDPANPTPTILTSLPAGSPPNYIKRICFWLERALAAYTGPRFGLRNPAAGGRIEVVVNTGGFGSASSSVFFINNALPPDVLCAVAVHELFHMVHGLYGGAGTTWRYGSNEGGAVWAEDSAAEFLNRYLDEAGTNFNGSGYMVQPHTSLEDVNFRYKTSLFWRYMAEQQSAFTGAADEPMIGVEMFKEVLERCEAGSWSSDDIRTAVRNLPWYQDFYEFAYMDPARLDRQNSETLFGNFALAAYLKDLGVNTPDRRFDFMEDEENIGIDDVIAIVLPGQPLQTTLASVARAGVGTLSAANAVSFSNSVPRFASRYFEVTVDPGVTSVQLQCTAGAGLTSVLFQAALIDEDNVVREIYRSDYTSYSKRFPNLREGKRLNRIAVVVSGCASSGSFTVTLSDAAAATDVMVTRWHSVMKTEYEVDPRNWAWSWVSPDIFVDTDGDGVADGTVFFNVDNKLFIRLHNKGNLDASGIGVEFWYQDAAGGLSDAGWLPVRNTGGTIQTLSGLSLLAGASNKWSVDWAPAPSGSSNHFCVRAVVTAPGDPNTDNKRVQSNFGNVQVAFGGFQDISLTRRHLNVDRSRLVDMSVVPRFRHQFEIAPRDLVEQRSKVLKAGEAAIDQLRIQHRPVKTITRTPLPKRDKGEKDPCPCAAPVLSHLRDPDPSGDYPLDPRTLPPGVEKKPMVTVVYREGGLAIGGVTLMLSVDGK